MLPYIICFRCVPLEETEALPTYPVLSVKGYGSRVYQYFDAPISFTRLSSGFNAIAFDGDNLSETSFTKMIAFTAFSRAKDIDKSPFSLFAVKYAHELPSFFASWKDKLVYFTKNNKNNLLKMVSGDISTNIGGNGQLIIPVNLYYVSIPQFIPPDSPGNSYYRYLGEKGLKIFGSKVIAVFGGGGCVLEEFEACMENVDTSSAIWHLYGPISRPIPGTRDEVGEEFASLININHPNLIKSYEEDMFKL
jgi:hypothetical protein